MLFFLPSTNIFRFFRPPSMLSVFEMLDISKLLISNLSKPELANIKYILVTFEVSKLDKFNLFKLAHWLNISDMSDTLDVTKFVRSKLVKE